MVPQPVNHPVTDDLFVLTEDYYAPVGVPFRIKAGTIWDLASVPRVFYTFVPRDGLIRAGSLVHDYICDRNGRINAELPSGKCVPLIYSWESAARLFDRINMAAGVPLEICQMAYRAVLAYGICVNW